MQEAVVEYFAEAFVDLDEVKPVLRVMCLTIWRVTAPVPGPSSSTRWPLKVQDVLWHSQKSVQVREL